MKGLRGFAAGVLTLVALQVLGSGQGPVRGGQLVAWAGTGVRKLMAANVPGVPRAKTAPPGKAPPASTSKPSTGGISGQLPKNPPTVYV